MVIDRTHSPRGHSHPQMVPHLTSLPVSPLLTPRVGSACAISYFTAANSRLTHNLDLLCLNPLNSCDSIPSPLQLPSNIASDSFSIKSHNYFNISYFLTRFQSAPNLPIASTPLTIFPWSQYDIFVYSDLSKESKFKEIEVAGKGGGWE